MDFDKPKVYGDTFISDGLVDLTMAVEDDNSILDDNANCEIVSDTDDVVDAADAYASAAVSPPFVLICN